MKKELKLLSLHSQFLQQREREVDVSVSFKLLLDQYDEVSITRFLSVLNLIGPLLPSCH